MAIAGSPRHRTASLRAAVARRACRRVGHRVGIWQRHGLPRPRRLVRRGRGRGGRAHRGAPRARRRAARAAPSRRSGLRLRRRLCAPDAPGQRHAGRVHPRLLAAAVADGQLCRRARRHAAPALDVVCGGAAARRGHFVTGDVSDLLVIGGGVMGLFTAYHAAQTSARVVVLERGRIGDPTTASYGRTRSFRNDYLDPTYARLAHEAFHLWGDFERETGSQALVRCGCLNIGKRAITPDLVRTYAQLSFETLRRLGLKTEFFDGEALRRRFSYLDADVAFLDVDGGVVDLPAVTRALIAALGERIHEGVTTSAIVPEDECYRAITDAGEFVTRSLIVTAGHGTNDVLALLPECHLRVPITRDRPSEAKYFTPPTAARHQFTSDAMPVIAYLDAGISCHSIVDALF